MNQIVCAETHIFTFHLSDVASFTVRAIVDEHGEPWFVAADVCAALGYSHTPHAMRMLDAAGIAYETIQYEVDENDLSGVHVAAICGLPVEEVFKTLVDTMKNFSK